jgi:plasmid stabilization system protein ParE
MRGFLLSPDADEDVFQIWSYLFQRAGIETANRIESELYDAFEALTATPGQGHRRSDLTNQPVLFFALYQYMIVYRVKTSLEIVRVLHGKRDLGRILQTEATLS